MGRPVPVKQPGGLITLWERQRPVSLNFIDCSCWRNWAWPRPWNVGEHTLDDLGDLRLVCVEIERREEAQRTQVKGHNWWNTLLEIHRSIQSQHTDNQDKKNLNQHCWGTEIPLPC